LHLWLGLGEENIFPNSWMCCPMVGWKTYVVVFISYIKNAHFKLVMFAKLDV
jgi:hypothetical protein